MKLFINNVDDISSSKSITNKIVVAFLFVTMNSLLFSCQSPSDHDEYVFAVQLVDDQKKIDEYLKAHEQIWPEVEESFRKAGYERIRLFRFGNYISMIVEVPEGANLDQLGQLSLSYHERVQEWNSLMSGYQQGLPGTKNGQTWAPMELIYEYTKEP